MRAVIFMGLLYQQAVNFEGLLYLRAVILEDCYIRNAVLSEGLLYLRAVIFKETVLSEGRYFCETAISTVQRSLGRLHRRRARKASCTEQPECEPVTVKL